jgi:hypothetical protein
MSSAHRAEASGSLPPSATTLSHISVVTTLTLSFSCTPRSSKTPFSFSVSNVVCMYHINATYHDRLTLFAIISVIMFDEVFEVVHVDGVRQCL